MNFFQQQDHARRLSRRLTLLFIVSVAFVVLALDAAAYAVGAREQGCLMVALATLACIAGGSLNRMSELSGGGQAVAEMCGGRRILPASEDAAERRLLNIMEEMALAAGIPVPQAYVLDRETAINAFAAGLSSDAAVVTVTRGTLEKLNRDELQGVIGHEFSHILNGDMRLNLRMIGLLAGIQGIALMGLRLLRVAADSRKGGVLAVVALVMLIAGYIGKFCANIIRAAVSRQREYLADASAVQFTRNPDGIAGALMKIEREGSSIEDDAADEIAHMCLGSVSTWSATGLLATHPPIAERIARLVDAAHARALHRTLDEPVPRSNLGVPGRAASSSFSAAVLTPQAIVDSVGRPAAQHIQGAAKLLARIPPQLAASLRTEVGAKALIAALLYGETASAQSERDLWAARGEGAAADLARQLRAAIESLGPAARLPLVDLALPVLKAMPVPARRAFVALAAQIAAADSRVTFFEFVLLTVLERQLSGSVQEPAVTRPVSLQGAQGEVALVLSVFAHSSGSADRQPLERSAGDSAAAFARAASSLGCSAPMVAKDAISLAGLRAALQRLRDLAPLTKPALIKACAQLVLADGVVSEREFELMRAVCAAIDSPVPPALETPSGLEEQAADRAAQAA